MFLRARIARAEAPGQDRAWCVGGTVGKPGWWSRVSEGERGRRGEWGGDGGRSCRAIGTVKEFGVLRPIGGFCEGVTGSKFIY